MINENWDLRYLYIPRLKDGIFLYKEGLIFFKNAEKIYKPL